MSQLRDRGFRGGRIAPHRAMIRLELSWTLLVDLFAIPLIVAVAVWVVLPPLVDAWARFFEAVRGPLGMPGMISRSVYELGPFAVAIPYFSTTAYWPSPLDLQTGWLVTLTLFAVGWFLKGRLLPVGYFLRFFAIIQCTAQLWFTFATPPFGFGLSTYVAGLLAFGVVLLVLIPYLVAFTFNIFDFRLWQKLLLSALLVGHLAVLLPLQATVHAWIIHRASLLAMPVLFLLFGTLLVLFVYVALYGWGMSWRSDGPLDAVDRRPPVRTPRYPAGRSRPTPTPSSVAAIPSAGFRMSRPATFPALLVRRLGFGDRR
jgi:hypothetical protein